MSSGFDRSIGNRSERMKSAQCEEPIAILGSPPVDHFATWTPLFRENNFVLTPKQHVTIERVCRGITVLEGHEVGI